MPVQKVRMSQFFKSCHVWRGKGAPKRHSKGGGAKNREIWRKRENFHANTQGKLLISPRFLGEYQKKTCRVFRKNPKKGKGEDHRHV